MEARYKRTSITMEARYKHIPYHGLLPTGLWTMSETLFSSAYWNVYTDRWELFQLGAFVFVRASVAFNGSGVEVAASTPVYEEV